MNEKSPDKLPVVAIVGATASGKTELAIHLAKSFRGEVINADSRQIYAGLDIGTAKPSIQERSTVPHHLFDIANINETYSLVRFLSDARDSIGMIHSKNHLPFIVGGTGQYLWALLEGWEVPEVKPDPIFRKTLELRELRTGPGSLHRELECVDPNTASIIDPRNTRRIIRALEVFRATKIPLSHMRSKRGSTYAMLILGIKTNSREELYERIDRRVENMVAAGWENEVKHLLKTGLSPKSPGLTTMGYQQISKYLFGEMTLDTAIARIKIAHHRLVRRQNAWFKGTDSRIRWVTSDDNGKREAELELGSFLPNNWTCTPASLK